MSDALSIAATGLQAQQTNLDTIANNLVNLSTPGFKKGRVTFTDLLVAGMAQPPQGVEDSLLSTPRVGAGVGISQLARIFEGGEFIQTGAPLDVAIEGDGFLEVALADGTVGYFRGGSLKVDADGFLATQTGYVLKPGLRVPQGTTALAIAADGTIQAGMPGQARPTRLGQLQLVRFQDPTALQSQGGSLYLPTPGSGEPIPGRAGVEGMGTLRQGVLEGSNVKMTDEFVNLMLAQQSYQASAKVVQAADELVGMINNLRK